jgi:filamentous hemagglutinin
LKQAFDTGGATARQGAVRTSSSGNAQILNVEGSSTGVVQVQYSPASTQSSHVGQYYKFTYVDGSELKVIDPVTYRVLGWPENGGKTTFMNPGGKVITYDSLSKIWR